MKIRNILITSLLSLVTACTTAYREADFNKVPKANAIRIERLSETPITFNTDKNPNRLSYEQTLKVAQDYSGLSSHSLNLGMSTGNEVSFSNLNLTGIRNTYLDRLKTLEKVIGDGDSVSSIFLGSPDSKSNRAREYQLSNSSSLQGVSFITSDRKNKNFFLNINKTDGLVKNRYTVSIAFGFPNMTAEQKVVPISTLENLALDAGVGYLIAGPLGIPGFAGHRMIEEPLAMILGKNTPKETRRVRGQMPITSLPKEISNTLIALEEATRQNTHTLLAIKNKKGTGMLYLSEKPNNVIVNGDTVSFTLEKKNAYNLFESLMRLSTATVVLGADKENFYLINGDNSSGGESSGSGGK